MIDYKEDIKTMDFQQLGIFARRWFLNKEDIEPTLFREIDKAIHERQAQLHRNIDYGCNVEMSELKEGEV